MDRGGARPKLTQRHVLLFAVSGFMSALIRVTIVSALEFGGPNVTAAIVPSTPVITTIAALVSGMETLHVHQVSGELIMGGMALCCLSAIAMGMFKGPLLFGKPPVGDHAPHNIPLGALTMLFNCVVSSLLQLVNKKALAIYPLYSCTAFTEGFAVLFLALFAAASAPASDWWVNAAVVRAVLFGGLLATALNNVLIARANRRLGPVVANLYVPCQPLFTAILDWIFLGDAFYLSNIMCGAGVVIGLVMVKMGRLRQLREMGLKAPSVVELTAVDDVLPSGAKDSSSLESAPPEEGDTAKEETNSLLAGDQPNSPRGRKPQPRHAAASYDGAAGANDRLE
jgi:drug/metabolite transporter (DMT)-like permease